LYQGLFQTRILKQHLCCNG